MAEGSRKIGRNRKSPANANYKAQGRLERNKKRNVATEARRQERDAEKRAHRILRRKEGAVSRLERRIKQAHKEGKPTGKLYESLNKAMRARVDAVYWASGASA